MTSTQPYTQNPLGQLKYVIVSNQYSNQYNDIEHILNLHPNLATKDDGNSLVMLAIISSNNKALKLLTKKGAPITANALVYAVNKLTYENSNNNSNNIIITLLDNYKGDKNKLLNSKSDYYQGVTPLEHALSHVFDFKVCGNIVPISNTISYEKKQGFYEVLRGCYLQYIKDCNVDIEALFRKLLKLGDNEFKQKEEIKEEPTNQRDSFLDFENYVKNQLIKELENENLKVAGTTVT